MKLFVFKYSLFLSLLMLVSSLLAQVKKDTSIPVPPVDQKNKKEQQTGTIKEEIEVIRPYKPILADAVKIRINPDLTNNPTFRPSLAYTILDKKLEVDSNIAKLQAQKFSEEKKPNPNNNYVKVGIGNLNTSLGELYLNNGKDEALQVGAYFKHLDQQGKLDKQQFSRQELAVFGRNIGRRTTIGGELDYGRRQTNFYGFDPLRSISLDYSRQEFNIYEAKGEILNNYVEGNHFSYKLAGSVYKFKDALSAKEDNIFVSTTIGQAVGNFNFNLNASLDLTNSQDLIYSIDNRIYRAHPHVQFQVNNFVLNLGVHIIQEKGSQNRLNILPAVSVVLPLASSYASLFGGVSGDVVKGSLKKFTYENPYLNQNVVLLNTIEDLHVYGGIKGKAGHTLGFKATALYKRIKNMQLFQNNASQINRLDIIYDPGVSTVVGLEGELEFKASEVINLLGKAQLNNYQMATEQKAWLKPALQVESTVRAKISKKMALDAEVIYCSETHAKIVSPTSGVPDKSTQLKGYVDMNAGAEYQILKNARLYIRATNILGTSYQQYLYYPKLGLGIFGGVNFSF